MTRANSGTESWQAHFRQGMADIFPVLVSAAPFGIIFGALAAEKGIPFGQIIAMSALMYAGASQMVALELWAFPPPFWTIVIAVLAVNFRHVLYSASLGRKMRSWSPSRRFFGFGFLVDPVFALADAKSSVHLSGAYYAGMTAVLYPLWIAASAVGALFGNLIDDPKVWGLDFIITAYFVVLVMGFRARPNAATVIATSSVVAVLVYLVIGPPWHVVTGGFAGILAAAVLVKPDGRDADSEPEEAA